MRVCCTYVQDYCTVSNVLAIILCSIIWRICNLFEELQHTHARYDDSVAKVFGFIFHFNNVTIVIIVLAIASLIVSKKVYQFSINCFLNFLIIF